MSDGLPLKRQAEEIVQMVMLSVIMKEHPSVVTEAIYQKLRLLFGETDE
jgi:hypothetical protein